MPLPVEVLSLILGFSMPSSASDHHFAVMGVNKAMKRVAENILYRNVILDDHQLRPFLLALSLYSSDEVRFRRASAVRSLQLMSPVPNELQLSLSNTVNNFRNLKDLDLYFPSDAFLQHLSIRSFSLRKLTVECRVSEEPFLLFLRSQEDIREFVTYWLDRTVEIPAGVLPNLGSIEGVRLDVLLPLIPGRPVHTLIHNNALRRQTLNGTFWLALSQSTRHIVKLQIDLLVINAEIIHSVATQLPHLEYLCLKGMKLSRYPSPAVRMMSLSM